nr:hypothetical protein CFP56_31482 [Quercus suber]
MDQIVGPLIIGERNAKNLQQELVMQKHQIWRNRDLSMAHIGHDADPTLSPQGLTRHPPCSHEDSQWTHGMLEIMSGWMLVNIVLTKQPLPALA